ncbi:MAG: helix-turn-helix domain-containing protein [Planctomycetales bacterium]|nr:helix-turn-helix domain-containing protein [Planctomycetales bacterium]
MPRATESVARPRRERAFPLFLAGRTDAEVAADVGVNPATAWRWRKRPEVQSELHRRWLDAAEFAVLGDPSGRFRFPRTPLRYARRLLALAVDTLSGTRDPWRRQSARLAAMDLVGWGLIRERVSAHRQ